MKEAIEALREGLKKEKEDKEKYLDKAIDDMIDTVLKDPTNEDLIDKTVDQFMDDLAHFDSKPQDITITKENDLGSTWVKIDQGKTFVLPKDFEADLTAPSIFQDITREMYNLYKAKNADYGSSVSDTYNKYGMVSYLVRMEDKLNRARTLVQKGDQKVSDEKLRDTLVDLANYAILAIIELEGDK